jgi:dTDP-glucose 4,6-dehydratase
VQNSRPINHILVTGGAGFIGSAFIRHVLTRTPFQGALVNLDALTYAGNLENLKEVEGDPRYVFVQGDIRNSSLVAHLCREYAIDVLIY